MSYCYRPLLSYVLLTSIFIGLCSCKGKMLSKDRIEWMSLNNMNLEVQFHPQFDYHYTVDTKVLSAKSATIENYEFVISSISSSYTNEKWREIMIADKSFHKDLVYEDTDIGTFFNYSYEGKTYRGVLKFRTVGNNRLSYYFQSLKDNFAELEPEMSNVFLTIRKKSQQ